MAHQYAPTVEPGGRIVTRRWPDDPVHRSLVEHSRDDLLLERPEAGVCPDAAPPKPTPWRALAFTQAQGPFTSYRRTVERDGDELVESTEYGVTIPWFGWLFRWPVRAVLGRRISAHGVVGATGPARPDPAPRARPAGRRVDERGVREHAVHPDGQLRRRRLRCRQHRGRHRRRGGARRHRHRHPGRRARRSHRSPAGDRVAWRGSHRCCRCSARSPRRSVSSSSRRRRPPARARARLPGGRRRSGGDAAQPAAPTPSACWRWPAGFGAGVAVIALPLADVGASGWRLVYVVSLVWCLVALDLARRLPETGGSTAAHITKATHRPPINRRRLGLLAAVAFMRQHLRRAGEFLPEPLPHRRAGVQRRG